MRKRRSREIFVEASPAATRGDAVIGSETGRAELRRTLVVTIAAALVLGGVGTAALLTDSATRGAAWSTTSKTTPATPTTTGPATTTVTLLLPTTSPVSTT